jgi:predicted PolB exonuclease-like 3'-5' exonuclease
MSPYPLNTILFIDLETVSQYAGFEELPDAWKELWRHKAEGLLKDDHSTTPGEIYGRAAIYPEFGKIICISCGYITDPGPDKKIRLTAFYGDDEKVLLMRFIEMLRKWAPDNKKFLCAHNGKSFDFPYLCRRMLINGLPIPSLLDLAGKKPWEIPHIDTMDLWKFGDPKSFVSLNLLAHALGLESPKDDIDGSQVGEVYWTQRDLARIVTYCHKDVVTVAQVYLRLSGELPIRPENIEIK